MKEPRARCERAGAVAHQPDPVRSETMSKKTVARRQRPPKPRAPHDAWTALATVTGDVFDVQAAIGLHRAAILGWLAEAAALRVPTADVAHFLEPALDGLLALDEHALGVAHRLVAAASELHTVTGCRS
jgi:hypothetical protein